jgi:putative transposase
MFVPLCLAGPSSSRSPCWSDRRKLLTENIDTLREVFKAARRRRPFAIEAIVILPDHLHLDPAF